jgi:hypothetical protein
MNKHTSEPWQWYWRQEDGEANCGVLYEERPGMAHSVCRAPRYEKEEQWEANAARIVACVNAMEGLTNEQVAELRASRDELLSALKDVLVMWKSPQPTKLDEALSWRQNDINAEAAARAAISRAAATGQPEQPK